MARFRPVAHVPVHGAWSDNPVPSDLFAFDLSVFQETPDVSVREAVCIARLSCGHISLQHIYIIHAYVYVWELLWTANLKGLPATQTEGANCVRRCGGET